MLVVWLRGRGEGRGLECEEGGDEECWEVHGGVCGLVRLVVGR